MEGFSFVTPVTGLNRPKTGKEDDDDLLICSLFYDASSLTQDYTVSNAGIINV
jgi:hypothetical protein